ncbi:cupin domain-containing protein [Caldimonas sp. KR1-144]|uniref:cupin domain-containing protein n=1 Tax=Caldimonas sp. KR1-144 TaxID=3400911 RepID=UPI003C098C2D
MHVINHSALPRTGCDGCQRQTVAGAAVGPAPFEVELLCVEAGARWTTPAQPHPRVLLVLAGTGKQRLEADPQHFHAPCTLIVPAGVAHEIVNNGVLALRLVAIFMPRA